jgi:hypothetical protein
MDEDIWIDGLPDESVSPDIALLCICKAIMADVYTHEETLHSFGNIPDQTSLITTCGYCRHETVSIAPDRAKVGELPPTVNHRADCIVPVAQKAIEVVPDNDSILRLCRSFLKRQEEDPVLSYFPQTVVIQMAIDKVTRPMNIKLSHEVLSLLAEYLIDLVMQNNKWHEML